MNEEFRAWHIAEKRMYIVSMISWRLGVVECLRIGMGLETMERFRLNEVILLQDTTLRDKGGKGDKLFAGDVVEVLRYDLPNWIGIIEQVNGCWKVVSGEKKVHVFDYVYYQCGGKKGNKYQNPKLMEKSSD